jgi:serine phosphatase RsbU (regulator of sigma subunit)
MKLTKKLEAEILELYHKYWDAYLNGNMRIMSSLMDENIQMIGSGMGEVFRNKKETVKYYKATADQVSGKSEVRNKKITVKLVGSNILIIEESEFFVLIDKIWTFYGLARISTLFGKSKNKWKIIQQHGSLPDSRTEGGEQVNTDKIKEENLRLKEAIKRRTIELENKNRELEIETSLEKVRTIAMGMRKPADMLDVCKTISLQLESLGVKEIRNVQTAIFYEQQGTYMNYEYYAKHNEILITETVYTNHEIHEEFATKMLSGKGEVFITHIKGKDVKDWIAYQKTTNVFIDKYLETALSLNYYWFSLGPVALGISTYHPLTEKEINLFKRFLKVFELAYQRYLDIEKAQAQAREAQIEASLERVRAVAMSMNKSEDLLSICEVSFKEFRKLGFDNLRNTIINILNDEKEFFLDYDYSDYLGGSIYNIGYNSHPIVEDYLKKIKRSDDAFAEVVIEGNQLNNWKDFRRSVGQRDDPRLDETQGLYYYLYSIGVGDIGISTFRPIDESQIKILKRFRNVFDLAYRRYNDITLAEAQAREAQIELTLERVRARTMVMQSSNELKEVVANMFDGMKSLGVDPTVCNIALVDKKTCDTDVWTAHQTDHGLITYKIFISHFEHPFRKNLLDSFLNEISFSVHELSGDLKKSYTQYLFEHVDYSKVPAEVTKSNEELANMEEGIVLSAAYMKYGLLIVSRSSAISNDESDILQRFAKIFEQTYTRFLDLQKAEAQAREAQIEAALERVRSRSMGMQKSEELKEVIKIVYQQLTHLKIKLDHSGFVVDYTPRGDWHFWIADEQDIPSKITHPYFESVWANQFNEAKEKGADFFVTNLNFEEKNKFYNELLSYVPGLPEASKDFYLSCPGLAISTVLLENVGLYIENFSGIPYSDEENKILMRFGKVFQQTYTRFLDLQKAEAQAREAQIEAALERVRSKTMAMHNSQDVGATVVTLFDEVLKLGLDKSIRVGIGILEGNEGMETWSATSTPDGEVDLKMGMLDMTIHPMLTGLKKAWESGKKCYSYDYIGDDVFRYYEALNNEPDYPFQADLDSLPENEYHKSFFYTEGILFSFAPNPISDEASKVLDRFAGVFGQTYRRYLDLQKAEEQAREAQIEAALERVRSKAMAMHSSEDLGLTVDSFFAELKSLNVSPHRCGVGIVDGETRIVGIQAIDTNQNNEIKKIVGNLKLAGHPVLDKIFESWVKQTEYYPVLRGEEILEYYKVMNPQVKFHEFADDEVQYGYYFYFKEGGVFAWTDNELQERDIEIFRRYTSVLSLTYRRYLDLKDAEAQAQEAKIEASLERVRSKAMAMHSPNDLSETVNVFFKELKTLDIIPIRCGVAQIDEATRTTSLTTTTSSQQGDSFEVIGKIKQTGHPVLDGIFENWKMQKEYHPVLEGAEIKAFYNVMKAQIAYPDYSEDTTQFGNLFPFKEGFVFAWTESKLTDEELLIFRRFTSVLSLTYRRYIDLKEAEARSVEAVRQASLDRVRAEIASMRTTNDLEKITPLIWRELTTLGVPFFRCGVFIIDEANYIAHAYLSTPLGKSLAALHVKINNTWLENAVKHWRNGEIYHEVWDRNKFLSWTQTMMEQGFVENKEHFQAGKEAPETLSLQLLPFTQGMLYVGSKLPLSNEEIKIAEKLADDFGVAYSRYEDFQKLEAVNHRKTLELEEARQLQLSMLPKELPKLPNLDIAVYMKTATEVGGDYYDFNIGIDGTLTVAIGDATGHGMKAGTIVSMIKALFASGGSKMDMKTYFKQSSDALKGIELGRLMMAFLMLRINSNKLHFANAAMPPVYIYKKQSKDVEEIMINGMPLGAIKDFPYQIREMEISPGDTILLLSDGLPELKNGKDEHYGYDRVKDEFNSVAEKSPDEIVDYLNNSAAEWINGVEPDDDVTFVVIKIR